MGRSAERKKLDMEYTRDFKGVWIPKEIYLAEDLCLTEKILLVEIDSLDNENGCFATNEHFSKFLGVSKDRVSKMISNLARKGLVSVELIYKSGSKQIEKRILHTPIGYRYESLGGIGKNNDTPIGKKAEDNNTVINNTINNTKNKKEKGGINALIASYTTNQELVDSIKGFIQMRAAKKKPMTDRALKMLFINLDKLESTDERKIKVLDQSTLNCWQGVFPLKEEKGGVNNVNNGESKDPYDPFDI